MTQVTTIAESGDRVVVGRGWLIRMTGFLALFSGFALAFLLLFSGAVAQGFMIFVLTLVLLPCLVILASLLWRFYWYVVTGLLSLFILALIIGWGGVMQNTIRLPERWNGLKAIIGKGSPVGMILAIVIAALAAASLYHLYSLWRMGGLSRLRHRLSDPKASALFRFDLPGPSSAAAAHLPLGERVMQHLYQTGHRGERQGDIIHVYKRQEFVGIVRVVESAGAISPLLIKDVERHRSKLGVKVAYLATAGWFTDEVRQMADQMGIKLITI